MKYYRDIPVDIDHLNEGKGFPILNNITCLSSITNLLIYKPGSIRIEKGKGKDILYTIYYYGKPLYYKERQHIKTSKRYFIIK